MEPAAQAILDDLQATVERVRQQEYAGTFPDPLANVVADYLAIARGYAEYPEQEAARGWGAMQLLRGMKPSLGNVFANARKLKRGGARS